MNPLKVLFVENDEEWAQPHCANLKRTSPAVVGGGSFDKWIITHVTNQQDADAAVRSMGKEQYDLILLDLVYPEVPLGVSREEEGRYQGMLWLPELRVLQPKATIVVVTQHTTEGHMQHVIDAIRNYHADDVVPKDTPFGEIVSRYAVAFSNSRRRQKILSLEKEWRLLSRSGAARVYIQDVAELLTNLRHPMDQIAERIESGDPSAVESAPEEIRAKFRAANKELHCLLDKMEKHLSLADKQKQSVDLAELVRDFLMQYDDWIEEAQSKAIGPPHGFRLEVSTYVGELKVALHEVIANAIEALGSSRRPPAERELVITAAEEGGATFLLVEDNGDGFPDEVLANPFMLGKTTRNRKEHVGMGLYVARRAMFAVGGDIKPENRAEGGARVKLFVPNLKLA
jgi:signal transduction histidine kinase